MLSLKDKLIVALDVDTLEKAQSIVERLSGEVQFFKIGSQLFTAYGPKAVEMVGAKGGKVFLDLKFHDIPNTVYLAASAGSGLNTVVAGSTIFPVFMMTVHVQGGMEMLKKAVSGAQVRATVLKIKKPYIVGVTKLTSEQSTEEDVSALVEIAKDAGLDGVVCSPLEAKKIRTEFGKDFIIVTPGIRAAGAPIDDQKRTATARQAIEVGASFIVVGRPILEAKDPLKAVQELIQA